jgi:DNA polymerase III epsilon subunit-like protein
MIRRMAERRLVFLDLETGGPDAKRHPITQLAAIAVDANCEPIEAFEAKLRFDKNKANAYSLRKNHYHPGVWAREARDPKEVAIEFAAFLKRHSAAAALSAQGKAYQVAQLVAHNAAFDGPFLMAWYERLGIYLPARRLLLCTMQLAMWLATTGDAIPPANFQLATLCAHYGIPFHAAKAHDALADVAATVQLHRTMLSRVRYSQPRASIKAA